jgi:hypothetical protein
MGGAWGGVRWRGLPVPSGRGAILCVLILSLLFSSRSRAFGAEPRIVFTADNPSWRIDLLATSLEGEATVDVSNCALNVGRWKIGAGETLLVEDFGSYLCGTGSTIGLASPRIDGWGVISTRASYSDAQGYVAAFDLPVLTDALPGAVELWPVRSDADYSTFLVLFNEGSQALATIAVFDEKNALVATESVALLPGINEHLLQTTVRAGRLEIRDGGPCFGCTADGSIYGFAAIALRAGGSPSIVPFRSIDED